ncbi:MAG: phosphoribosylglycinamide formyltransferase [Clostridiales bacterium]|nr:phosphoribosylglycinamide formyltransferase [Clostridiales bacterium]MDY5725882.1 phosphoribosylglycinamide formyltransferase [Eubacteriales bacterium]
MRKVKIAVLVSGGGTNLQALIDSQKNGVIKNGEIVLVVSNKETAFALERAKKAKVKTRVVTKTGKSREEFESELIKVLRDDRIELVVLAGFMVILSERFTSTFKDRIINVHPSLIPSFCGEGFYGLKVHAKALEYGGKVTGATVHFVNEIPDGGKIIMQKPVEVLEGDTPEILQERVMKQAEWIILPLATEKVCSDILKGEM